VEERRKELRRRLPAGQGVSFFIQGKEERLVGIVDDICDDGMGITVDGCLAIGTVLEIILDDEEVETYLIGEVKWCDPDEWLEGTFHMGVAIHGKLEG